MIDARAFACARARARACAYARMKAAGLKKGKKREKKRKIWAQFICEGPIGCVVMTKMNKGSKTRRTTMQLVDMTQKEGEDRRVMNKNSEECAEMITQ